MIKYKNSRDNIFGATAMPFYKINNLFLYCVLAIIFAFFISILHGIASKKKQMIRERVLEFGRNAFIQISAMLFALAVAQFSLAKNSEQQEKAEKIKIEEKEKDAQMTAKSIASGVSGVRATEIQRSMRRFDFRNVPRITPDCLSTTQPDEFMVIFNNYSSVSEDCRLETRKSINVFLDSYDKFVKSMESVVESMRVSDDWSRSSYLSNRLGRDILHDFRSVEDKLDYRLFVVQDLTHKIKSIEGKGPASDEEIRYISYIELAIAHFQKSSFIYLTMFYLTFGDLDEQQRVTRDHEKTFFQYVTRRVANQKEMNLGDFRLFLINGAKDCKFQEYGCAVLLGIVQIDKTIDFP